MSLLFYKSLAALLIFLTALLVVIYPIKTRAYPKHHHLLELADAFASGIFLGAALFHMLPDANQGFALALGNNTHPIAELFCAAGFLILLFLERLSHYTSGDDQHSSAIPYTLAVILIVHALIEGAVLGVNTTLATAFIIFLAIIAHKGSESFALAVILNRSNFKLNRIVTLIVLFSLMTPLGILLGTTVTEFLQFKTGQLITAGFNAFAAGTFLYMSTLHHINHHHRQQEAESLLEFVFLVIGLVIMAVIAWWA